MTTTSVLVTEVFVVDENQAIVCLRDGFVYNTDIDTSIRPNGGRAQRLSQIERQQV